MYITLATFSASHFTNLIFFPLSENSQKLINGHGVLIRNGGSVAYLAPQSKVTVNSSKNIYQKLKPQIINVTEQQVKKHSHTKKIHSTFTVSKSLKKQFFYGPYFLVCIQSEYRRIRTRKNSVFGYFSRNISVKHPCHSIFLVVRKLFSFSPTTSIKKNSITDVFQGTLRRF